MPEHILQGGEGCRSVAYRDHQSKGARLWMEGERKSGSSGGLGRACFEHLYEMLVVGAIDSGSPRKCLVPDLAKRCQRNLVVRSRDEAQCFDPVEVALRQFGRASGAQGNAPQGKFFVRAKWS